MTTTRTSRLRRSLVTIAALAMILALAACGGGVSQDDVDEVRGQLEDMQTRLSNVEETLTEIQAAAESEEVEALVEEALEEVTSAASTAEEAEETLTPPEPEPIDNQPPAAPGATPGTGQPAAPTPPQ